jgi:hypothetical protein
MKKTTNQLIKPALTLLLSTFLAACSDDDNDSKSAYVRILHASPDAPNVDVLVDGKAVLENVAYQQGSGYLKVTAGARDISLRVSGTDTLALEQSLTLADNGYYSVIAQDEVASLELEVLDDSNRQKNSTTDVTVVHSSPAAGSVDIYVTADGVELPSTPTLAAVPFDNNATLESIASGNYQVRITAAGSSNVIYNSSTLAIGGDVTAVAVDSIKGVSPASLLVWNNAVTPVLDASAELRILHAVDAVSVDVFADGSELLGDFDYKDSTIGITGASATGYLTVSAGELAVAIAPANQGIGNAVASLTGTLTLERGESYTVIAAGSVTELAETQLIVLNDMRESSGEADVRLVHAAAASAADPVDIFVAAAGSDISMATPNFADVVIGQNTGYTALDGSTAYDVVIAADGTTSAAVPGTANLTFGNDSLTTAIAIGNSVPNLEAIILNDKR